MRFRNFVCTKGGAQHFLDGLEQTVVTPEDLSGIAYIGRFNGATTGFYSVAQHSVLASQYAPAQFALEALLHDAHECLVGDCVSPIKRLLSAFGFSTFASLEKKAERAIAQQYRLQVSLAAKAVVKAIDVKLLATEKRDLMPKAVQPWPELAGIEPYEAKILPWSPEFAKQAFLSRLELLLWYRDEMGVMAS